jgi:hypothetical protein
MLSITPTRSLDLAGPNDRVRWDDTAGATPPLRLRCNPMFDF